MMTVAFHPVAGEATEVVRWRVTSPALPNRRLLAPPPALGALVGSVLAGVTAGCGSIETTLLPGRDWATAADAVRAALTADLQALIVSSRLDGVTSNAVSRHEVAPSTGSGWQWAPPDVDLGHVQRVAEAVVGPVATAHGGAIHILAVRDGVVQVKLAGACRGCSISHTTLQDRLAVALTAQVPGVDAVEAV